MCLQLHRSQSNSHIQFWLRTGFTCKAISNSCGILYSFIRIDSYQPSFSPPLKWYHFALLRHSTSCDSSSYSTNSSICWKDLCCCCSLHEVWWTLDLEDYAEAVSLHPFLFCCSSPPPLRIEAQCVGLFSAILQNFPFNCNLCICSCKIQSNSSSDLLHYTRSVVY